MPSNSSQKGGRGRREEKEGKDESPRLLYWRSKGGNIIGTGEVRPEEKECREQNLLGSGGSRLKGGKGEKTQRMNASSSASGLPQAGMRKRE